MANVIPLSSKFRVLVPDLPGFGDSGDVDGEDADACAGPVAAGLKQLVRGPVDVVGFSFGSMVAGFIYNSDPLFVRRIVLVGAPAFGVHSSMRTELKRWTHLKTQAEREAVHRENLKLLMLHRFESITETAITTHSYNQSRDRMRKRKLASTDILLRLLTDTPGRIRVDAIYGEEDSLYRGALDKLQPVLRGLPGFQRMERIKEAGHWVQFEAADEFNRKLLEILDEPVEASSTETAREARL